MVNVVNTRMPADEVAALDELVAGGRYRSRTEAIRDAVSRLLREVAEQDLVDAHRHAYAHQSDPTDEFVARRSRRVFRSMVEADE